MRVRVVVRAPPCRTMRKPVGLQYLRITRSYVRLLGIKGISHSNRAASSYISRRIVYGISANFNSVFFARLIRLIRSLRLIVNRRREILETAGPSEFTYAQKVRAVPSRQLCARARAFNGTTDVTVCVKRITHSHISFYFISRCINDGEPSTRTRSRRLSWCACVCRAREMTRIRVCGARGPLLIDHRARAIDPGAALPFCARRNKRCAPRITRRGYDDAYGDSSRYLARDGTQRLLIRWISGIDNVNAFADADSRFRTDIFYSTFLGRSPARVPAKVWQTRYLLSHTARARACARF